MNKTPKNGEPTAAVQRATIERRAFPVEVRVAQEPDQQPSMTGHAAVFNTIADLGFFKERVAPGTFTQTIVADDIRALKNHNPDLILGRSIPGRAENTLRLREDETGLAIEVDVPDTQYARDLMVSIKRGDITQMSFAFETLDDAWETIDGQEVRTLKRVRLLDVSPVTFPAYKETDVAVRSGRDVWLTHIAETRQAPAPAGNAETPPAQAQGLDILRKRLDLADKE